MPSDSITWKGHEWSGSLDVPSTATAGERISGSVSVERAPDWRGDVRVIVQRREKTSPVSMSSWSQVAVIGTNWGLSTTMSGSFTDTVPDSDRVDYRVLLDYTGETSLVSASVDVSQPEPSDDTDSSSESSGGSSDSNTITTADLIGSSGPVVLGGAEPAESEGPETPEGVPDSAVQETKPKLATAAGDELASTIRSASWQLWRDGYDVYGQDGKLIGTLDPVDVHGGVDHTAQNQTDQPDLVNSRTSGQLDISQAAYREAVVEHPNRAPLSEASETSGSGLIGSGGSSSGSSSGSSTKPGESRSDDSSGADVDLDEWGAPQQDSTEDTADDTSSGSDSSSDGSDGLPTGVLVSGGAVALVVILK